MHGRLLVRYMMGGMQSTRCQLCTISDIIARFSISQVDFLKIDVERGEMAVLEGILDEDWPKIRNVVVEVHDIEERRQKVCDLLWSAKFRDVAFQEASLLENTGLTNIYAMR